MTIRYPVAVVDAKDIDAAVRRGIELVGGIDRFVKPGADVVISVAGMEGALTSVIGGLVACPVIGVPTSVGYGAHFDGLAPLLAMLNSCAPGVAVVNIDNGFGAGLYAHLILRRIRDWGVGDSGNQEISESGDRG